MNIHTYYSSFLFVFTSFAISDEWFAKSLALLSCTSILHHSKFFEEYPGKRALIFADRSLAHIITLLSFIRSCYIPLNTRHNMFCLYTYYVCLAYVILIYYTYLKYTVDLTVHSTMHMASCVGIYFLFKAQ
jgi:hypothetical protein